MTHLLLWPDVVVDRWIWPSLGTVNSYPLMLLSSLRREFYEPAPWQTPKWGDGSESGSTEKQQAGWPSIGREAQRVIDVLRAR
jgi:hypothetical protein